MSTFRYAPLARYHRAVAAPRPPPTALSCEICRGTTACKTVHTGEAGTFVICDACWLEHGAGACLTWVKQRRRLARCAGLEP